MQLKMVAGALTLVIATTAGAQAQKAAPNSAPAAQPMSPTPTTTAPATTTAPTTATPTTPDVNAPGQSATATGQTGTTPGQEQTTPGQASQLTPAVTGQTPSGQTTGTAATTSTPQITAATAADVKAGVSVYDQKGGLVGKIVSTSAKGAVLDTGTVKAAIPTSGFAKGDKGLVISMTKAEIDASAKKATAKKK